MPDHAGFYEFVEDDEGRQWSGAHQNIDGTPVPMTAAILLPDRRVEVTGVTHDLTFYEGTSRLKGGRFAMTDETGTRREFEVEDLGWIYCQGGGYFDGFNDGLGQGVYRGEYHEEGEVWDCSQPVTILDAKGDEVQFNSVWAESFTRLRSGWRHRARPFRERGLWPLRALRVHGPGRRLGQRLRYRAVRPSRRIGGRPCAQETVCRRSGPPA